jgi:stage II sporulation protein P
MRQIRRRRRLPGKNVLKPILLVVFGIVVTRFIFSSSFGANLGYFVPSFVSDRFFDSVFSIERGTGASQPKTLWAAAVRSQSPLLSGVQGTEVSASNDPDVQAGSLNDEDTAPHSTSPLLSTVKSLSSPSPGEDDSKYIPAAAVDPNIKTITVEPASPDGYEYLDGVYIKNSTSRTLDMETLLSAGSPVDFSEKSKILIVHTHASEAYYPDGGDLYVPTDVERTDDKNYNMIRVGDEMASILTDRGYEVIHMREIFDYPSYNGSYTRTLAAIEKVLEESPDVALVIDLHRDAMVTSDGLTYRTVTEIDGKTAAQLMFVMGTDEGGLSHELWRGNLSFAAQLQRKLCGYDGLMRPISLSKSRYNQHTTPASLLLEVGTSGNTLQEALYSIQLFSRTFCDYLDELK